jgi:hypothetical protein
MIRDRDFPHTLLKYKADAELKIAAIKKDLAASELALEYLNRRLDSASLIIEIAHTYDAIAEAKADCVSLKMQVS